MKRDGYPLNLLGLYPNGDSVVSTASNAVELDLMVQAQRGRGVMLSVVYDPDDDSKIADALERMQSLLPPSEVQQ